MKSAMLFIWKAPEIIKNSWFQHTSAFWIWFWCFSLCFSLFRWKPQCFSRKAPLFERPLARNCNPMFAKNSLRRWNVIFQQAWSLFLRDKIEKGAPYHQGYSNKMKGKRPIACWCFNKGKCSYGSNCRFDHRCSACSSTEHGFSTCHNQNNREKKSN